VLAAATAGNANGTQQTPQATAPIAIESAATDAVRSGRAVPEAILRDVIINVPVVCVSVSHARRAKTNRPARTGRRAHRPRPALVQVR